MSLKCKKKDPQAWLTGIIKKRRETILVLHALVLAGLKKGRVSAEDAHHIPVSHPNCRGAAMKVLHHAGFEKSYPFQGKTPASHGHWMFMWTLYDVGRAQAVLNRLEGAVTDIRAKPIDQLNLGI